MPTDNDVRSICACIPAELRWMRAKALFTVDISEDPCPACNGAGMFPTDSITLCPLCQGFMEVPRRLADWYLAEVDRARSDESARSLPSAARRHSRISHGPRYGVRAERTQRFSGSPECA